MVLYSAGWITTEVLVSVPGLVHQRAMVRVRTRRLAIESRPGGGACTICVLRCFKRIPLEYGFVATQVMDLLMAMMIMDNAGQGETQQG